MHFLIKTILLLFISVKVAATDTTSSAATAKHMDQAHIEHQRSSSGDSYDFDSMFSKQKIEITKKSSNTIDVSKFEEDAEDEYSKVKTDYYYKHEYVPPGQLLKNAAEGNCFAIKNNEDMKNDCLAIVKSDFALCFSIRNKDLQNSCLGQVKSDSNYCFAIRNKDMMNACLAATKSDIGYCYSVKREDVKNSCLAQTKNDRNLCFAVNNKNLQNSCLAVVN